MYLKKKGQLFFVELKKSHIFATRFAKKSSFFREEEKRSETAQFIEILALTNK